jgi:hypothetical protein
LQTAINGFVEAYSDHGCSRKRPSCGRLIHGCQRRPSLSPSQPVPVHNVKPRRQTANSQFPRAGPAASGKAWRRATRCRRSRQLRPRDASIGPKTGSFEVSLP